MSVESPPPGQAAAEPALVGRRRWPWIAGGAGVLAAVVAATVLASMPRTGSGGIVCQSETGWCTYVDNTHGWTVKWPSGWRLQRLEGRCPDRLSGGTYPLWGAVISNLSMAIAPPKETRGLCSGAWDYRRLPPTLVVFDVRSALSLPLPAQLQVQPDQFPWSVGDATRITKTSEPTWGQPFPRYVWFGRIREMGFVGGLVFGPHVTAADRELAEKIVASLASR
jgi:hypothetical protein